MTKKQTLKERVIRRAFSRIRGNKSKRARVLRAVLLHKVKTDD